MKYSLLSFKKYLNLDANKRLWKIGKRNIIDFIILITYRSSKLKSNFNKDNSGP